jgi:ABC-type sugar transport system ATPase subunit
MTNAPDDPQVESLQEPDAVGGAGETPGPAGEPALLELTGISRRFGAIRALNDVCLDVRPGECIAIVGDNGAGKSTLVKIMSGVVRPDEGHMTFNGAPLEPDSPLDARRAGIETVYQDLALADHLDPVSNIFLGRELAVGRPRPLALLRRRQMRAQVKDLIDRTGVNIPSLRATVRQMSGGQRQGLAIARALAWDAKLIILDEPTAALGVRETAQVEDLIKSLSSHGVAVVIVSHNLQQVFRVAHRTFVMRHGRCVGRRVVADTHEEEIVGLITGAIQEETRAVAR